MTVSVPQAEEIHLEHADFFEVAHDPLRGNRDFGLSPVAVVAIALADHALHRHVIGDGAVGDDHPGRVRAGVAVGAFQLQGDVDHLPKLRVALVFAAKIGAGLMASSSSAAMAAFMGTSLHSWLTRSSGTSMARPTSFMAVLAASVPNVPIWATDSGAVFLAHVVDDILAAILAKVDVDIGRFTRLGSRKRSKSRSYSSGSTWLRLST